MFVSTVRPQNNNILIVSDKFWDKIVCDIFRHFKYLSQVRPQPKRSSDWWSDDRIVRETLSYNSINFCTFHLYFIYYKH